MRGVRAIDTNPTRELGMATLDALYGVENDARIAVVHLPVTVQVVHMPIPIVIDENVRRITVHVPTQAGSPFATRTVVLRRAKATHHRHMTNGDALAIQFSNDELEFVDQLF